MFLSIGGKLYQNQSIYLFGGGKLSYGTKSDKFLVITAKKVYYKVYRHRKRKDTDSETSYETYMLSYNIRK